MRSGKVLADGLPVPKPSAKMMRSVSEVVIVESVELASPTTRSKSKVAIFDKSGAPVSEENPEISGQKSSFQIFVDQKAKKTGGNSDDSFRHEGELKIFLPI